MSLFTATVTDNFLPHPAFQFMLSPSPGSCRAFSSCSPSAASCPPAGTARPSGMTTELAIDIQMFGLGREMSTTSRLPAADPFCQGRVDLVRAALSAHRSPIRCRSPTISAPATIPTRRALSRFPPGDSRIGLLRRDNAEALGRFSDIFAVESDGSSLRPRATSMRSAPPSMRWSMRSLSEQHVPKWRNETFRCRAALGRAAVFRLDRGAVPFFGTRAYGVHLNGYLRHGETLLLWVGRRSPGKHVAPDKLDNIVAGGIGNGHGVGETLLKEGEEEASFRGA